MDRIGLQEGELNLESAPNSVRTRPKSGDNTGNVVVAGLSDSNWRGREADADTSVVVVFSCSYTGEL